MALSVEVGICRINGTDEYSNAFAAGTSSRNSSSRFVVSSELKKLIPVRFPPGQARLRPDLA